MKKINSTVAAALLLAACSTVSGTRTLEGAVYDATMNQVTLVTVGGDTVSVSTMDADPERVPGVMVADSVKIACIGKNGILAATDLEVTVHSPYYFIRGTWTEPNPIDASEEQGFTLNPDGTAVSVNMATLDVKNWSLENGMLVLQYLSLGNGRTIEGADTLQVVRLDADSLVLAENGTVVRALARRK